MGVASVLASEVQAVITLCAHTKEHLPLGSLQSLRYLEKSPLTLQDKLATILNVFSVLIGIMYFCYTLNFCNL